MNRRAFNRLGTGAICFSSVSHILAETFDPAWKLGVITDQVAMELPRALSGFYKKYELRWAEIRDLRIDGKTQYVYAEATQNQLKQIRHQLDDAGVKLSVLDTAVYKVTLPGTVPTTPVPAYLDPKHDDYAHQLDDLKRAAEAVHALGADRVRIFTFRRVAVPETIFNHIVEQLHRAIEVARQQDITLLVENEYDCNIGTAAETARLFRAIPDRRLLHNWDPCNVYEMGEQPFPYAWDQLDHSRISHIHLKDAVGKKWMPIGSGKINFEGQFRALRRMGYSGTMSLETRYRDARRDSYASSVESMNGLALLLRKI